MSFQKFKIFFSSILVANVLFIGFNLFAEGEVAQQIKPVKDAEKSSFTRFQFSFFSPLQIFPEKDDVYGLRLTFPYGDNNTLKGVDFGIANEVNNLYGVSFAVLLSSRSENMYGVNYSGVFNISQGDDIGLSIAGFYNEVNTIEGVQTAILYNQAKMVKGVQFGLVNYCHDMQGAQIGIFNVCKAQPFPFTFLFNFWK